MDSNFAQIKFQAAYTPHMAHQQNFCIIHNDTAIPSTDHNQASTFDIQLLDKRSQPTYLFSTATTLHRPETVCLHHHRPGGTTTHHTNCGKGLSYMTQGTESQKNFSTQG